MPVPPAIKPTFLAVLNCTGSFAFSLIPNFPAERETLSIYSQYYWASVCFKGASEGNKC